MDNTRQHLGGQVPGILSASLLFFLMVAAILTAGAVQAAVPPSLLAEASAIGAPKPHADIPTCNPDWIPVPSPDPGTGVATLSGVAAVSADDAWAVGYYENSSLDQTLVLHWHGSSWSVVPSPNVGSGNNYLNGVVAVSADDVWAVGYYGVGTSSSETLILHWDGSAWSIVPNPGVGSSFNFLSTVAAVSTDDVWAVGYYVQNGHGQTLTMHWDGSAWSIIPSPNPGTTNSLLRGVTAISSDDVWVVGLESNSSTDDRTLTMHWDGTAWSIVPSPSVGTETNLLFSVDAVSTDDIWAVGFYYAGALGQTLILHWNGSAWSVIPSPNPGISHILRAVAVASANDVWAVGNYEDNSSNNQALVLHWNGSAWSASSSSAVGSTDNDLYGVAVLSASEAWAVGGYSSGGDQQTLVVRYEPCSATDTPTPGTPLPTRTATATPTTVITPTPVPTECVPRWAVVDSPSVGSYDNELRALAAISSDDIWAVGYYGDNTVGFQTLTEQWDGTAWNVVPSPNLTTYLNFLQGAAAISSDDVWAVGYYKGPDLDDPSETMTIHWDGISWSVVPSVDPDPQNNRLLGVTAISHNDVWAVGFLQDYDGVNEIDHTITEHWDGTAWSVIPSPNPSDFTYLYGVTAASSDDVWAVGLYHTSKDNALAMHWDGDGWDVVAVPNMGTADNDLYAVTAIASNDVWAVGKYVEYSGGTRLEHTLTEHWDGVTWNVVPSPDVGSESNTLNGVAALSSSDIWAGGEYHDEFAEDQTLTEHWDGSVWSVVSSPSTGGLNWLLGVAAISYNDVWAVGLHNDVYRTLTEHYSSPCSTPTALATNTPTITPTGTATGTPTGTPLATATNSPVSTGTPTGTVTGTPPTVTDTSTVTNTPTGIAANTSTDTPVASGTATATSSPISTVSLTSTATATPTIPTGTPAACTIAFEDVPSGSTFYPYIQCMACRGIINGYPCGGVGEPCDPNNDPYFRLGDNVTRGQLSKIVSLSAGYDDPPGGQLFEDVPPGSTFYTYIQQLASRGYISGYPCGSPGEPCVPPDNGPYFRPNNNATRGQISKIVSNAAGFTDPPGAQLFEDVLPGSTFYEFVQRLAGQATIQGYPCGSPGEPCVPPDNRPYFRPNNTTTRGQASKIVANTFFPECSPAR